MNRIFFTLALLCVISTTASAQIISDVVISDTPSGGSSSGPLTTQTVQCLDNGMPTAASITVNPSTDIIYIQDSLDINGCFITLSKVGATEGHRVTFISLNTGMVIMLSMTMLLIMS